MSSLLILFIGSLSASNVNSIPETAGNLPSKPGYLETPFSNASCNYSPVTSIDKIVSEIGNILLIVS